MTATLSHTELFSHDLTRQPVKQHPTLPTDAMTSSLKYLPPTVTYGCTYSKSAPCSLP